MGAEAQAFATSIVVEDAKVFFTGQKIQNVTKSDDNSSKGYDVTAVDERTNTLTVAPGISGAWAVDDVVTWWMPYGPAIGNELENADSVIRIDGTAGKMRSCTIKFSTPTEFTDELGDHFPGQPIDTMRASSVDFEYYMRNDAAKRLREGQRGQGSPVRRGIRQRGRPQGRRGLPPHQEQDARHQRRFRDRHPFAILRHPRRGTRRRRGNHPRIAPAPAVSFSGGAILQEPLQLSTRGSTS